MAPKASLAKLKLFRRHPELLKSEEYAIKSDVCQDVLSFFVDRLDGLYVSDGVTVENAAQLRVLSDEVGFTGFDSEIESALVDSRKVVGDSSCLVDRVKGLEAVVSKQQRQIAALDRKVRVHQRRKVRRKAVSVTRMSEDSKGNSVEQNPAKSCDVVFPREGFVDLNATDHICDKSHFSGRRRAFAQRRDGGHALFCLELFSSQSFSCTH